MEVGVSILDGVRSFRMEGFDFRAVAQIWEQSAGGKIFLKKFIKVNKK